MKCLTIIATTGGNRKRTVKSYIYSEFECEKNFKNNNAEVAINFAPMHKVYGQIKNRYLLVTAVAE